MRGSEVLKCLERGGKIRLAHWKSELYIDGKKPPYIRSSFGDQSLLSSIGDLYSLEWEEWLPPKVEQPILTYKEALTQLKAGDKVKILDDGNNHRWCSDSTGTWTGTLVNNYEYLNGNKTSLVMVKLDKYPTQTWGLGESCKVQKVT